MYFKKLELIGFKSFCDKTALHFEPGITAVVGPNGCGKSNIFDSIRWVLGEQSAKSLRGGQMQDVIFNGSDVKEPLSMAEVTLTFDNGKRVFNIDHPEVAITRRIFRSGESEYLLNKTTVRLKDILDLLMGTGIGAESYSIVAQGKIDLVLSSRPEDRRLVFDEAAGITKYKVQKRETMRKLEETEQNFLRVNDIITEVKRQIASLQRQANKARKYKEIFEDLKNKEISLSVLQKNELIRQKNEAIEQLRELEAGERTLLDLLKEEELKISNRSRELKTQEEDRMSIKNKILNLENLAVRNNEHICFNQEKITELEQNLKYLTAQNEQLKNKLILDKENLNNIQEEREFIKKNIDEKSITLLEKEAGLNELSGAIKNSLEIISKSKKGILEFAAKIAGVKNELSDFSAKQQIYLARKKRLEIEKAKAYEEKAISEDSLNKITQEIESLNKIVEDLKLEIGAKNNELDKEKDYLCSVNSEILELEREKLTLESHREFLQKLKTKYQDLGESMNAVIYLDKLPSGNLSGLVVRIKGYEQVIPVTGQGFCSGASHKLSGEAKPIELDTQNIDQKLRSQEENLGILRDKKTSIEAHIEGLSKVILDFSQALRGQELILANKETSRLTIWEQFNKIKEEEDIIAIELHEAQKEASILENNIKVSQGHLSELNKQHRQAEDLILQEEDNIAKNNKLREGFLVMITQTKTEVSALNRKVVSDEGTLSILEDAYARGLASLANIEKQINEAHSKKETLQLEIRDCELKIKEADIDLVSQNNLLKELEHKYRMLQEGAGEAAKKIEEDRRELDNLKNKLHELQLANKDIDYKYSGVRDRILQSYKIDLDTIENFTPLEIGCQRQPSVAFGVLSLTGFTQEINANGLAEEIEKLKEKLDSIGSVNLVAIEEYDELKKRYDFLSQQQNDLLNAKESLHQAILKINRITKQMFQETFEKVCAEFRNYFRLLFNGGDAKAFLIDEQDPLESGIEIICRPPGKKLQNVLLLSGGEKALSAIALIFAIFKIKPSPFCVLDEIDAALDEANVGRFSNALQEFAKDSQFIVITHNKRTIANANVMYGITMEESGISKIVSVKFAKEQDKQPENLVSEPV